MRVSPLGCADAGSAPHCSLAELVPVVRPWQFPQGAPVAVLAHRAACVPPKIEMQGLPASGVDRRAASGVEPLGLLK